ncbi:MULTISPECIES: PLDc N-terminal domain-containing protein [Nocardiopsis]|uniref:PLDc N-terminal domain-containing protein n=1 Tax=Nocardiopsis akebiae TaxID=2831968 RepID=A0ABX8BY76_9ACTN|nr:MULTISPECIES: PLDc N-terminal domain-containing protein [Nocardiopsis]QUX27135.1 PLDc N-terminal domain-containing protein [Nocardiopsis akebiae]WDZ93342.1 PLDc N-terminal domain-containing protein [Nocardiopsis sp. HUAS JQ3]
MSLLAANDPNLVHTVLPILLLVGVALVSLVTVVLIIAAVFSILMSRVDGAMKVVWLIFVCIAPLIGAILWFLVGRNRVPY